MGHVPGTILGAPTSYVLFSSYGWWLPSWWWHFLSAKLWELGYFSQLFYLGKKFLIEGSLCILKKWRLIINNSDNRKDESKKLQIIPHQYISAAAAKSLQSCLTLCDPIDGSLPGSPVPGILQARTLEWVAISFSNAGKWKVKAKSLSCVQLLATPWTAAHQAPPSVGFSRQEHWSGVPLPSLFFYA